MWIREAISTAIWTRRSVGGLPSTGRAHSTSSVAFLDQPKEFVTQPSVVLREPIYYFSEGDDRLPDRLAASDKKVRVVGVDAPL